MKDRQQIQGPQEEWARVYTDQSKDSPKAVELLRQAGYRVITFPVGGKIGPELKLGRNVYQGLEDIQMFLKK